MNATDARRISIESCSDEIFEINNKIASACKIGQT